MSKSMKYYHFNIGSTEGVMKAANNKYVAIQALREHLELPFADGSYIPEIHTHEISKEKFNKFCLHGLFCISPFINNGDM